MHSNPQPETQEASCVVLPRALQVASFRWKTAHNACAPRLCTSAALHVVLLQLARTQLVRHGADGRWSKGLDSLQPWEGRA